MNIHVETIGDKSCVYGTGCEATAPSRASSIRRYGSARLPLRACVRACVRACNETREHPPELVRNNTKHTKFPPTSGRTSRSLNKRGLGEGHASLKGVMSSLAWLFQPTGGNVLICHGEGRMSALIWDHTHRNCRWRALPRVFKVMMSHREVFTSISDVLMLAWSETRLLT